MRLLVTLLATGTAADETDCAVAVCAAPLATLAAAIPDADGGA
jgi:hypothetical protein